MQTCTRCKAETIPEAIFCHVCGENLRNTQRLKLTYSLAIIPIIFSAVYLSSYLSGEKPTKTFEQPNLGQSESIPLDSPRTGSTKNQPNPHDTNDSKLLLLRKEVADNPKDVVKLKEYADYLLSKIKDANGLVSQSLILEVVDALYALLQFEPKNADALGALADLSFDQRVFSKSVEYYKKYLELKPDDLAVKSRLASSLVFLKQTDEAITILNSVLEKDPKNFHALSYFAIALSEKGDLEGAKRESLKAIENAPSDEAKKRIETFIDAMIKKSVDKTEQAELPEISQPSKEGSASPLTAIESYLKTNEITSTKYIRGEQQDKIIKLYFKDFPMQAMPPFAKEKFFGKIKQQLSDQSFKINTVKITTVQFFDNQSNDLLEELKVSESPESP